jgi:hypothetical protein
MLREREGGRRRKEEKGYKVQLYLISSGGINAKENYKMF